GLYEALVEARQNAGDDSGAKSCAREWLAFLEGEAAKAPTHEARTVFDSHRLSALLTLGEPEGALAFLLQSKKDFPKDYNPNARLANVYRMLKRYDDALAESDEALAKVYGPRKLRVYVDRSSIFLAKSDTVSARKTLEAALVFARSLPEPQRR